MVPPRSAAGRSADAGRRRWRRGGRWCRCSFWTPRPRRWGRRRSGGWGWRVAAFAPALEGLGLRLILRRGPALDGLAGAWWPRPGRAGSGGRGCMIRRRGAGYRGEGGAEGGRGGGGQPCRPSAARAVGRWRPGRAGSTGSSRRYWRACGAARCRCRPRRRGCCARRRSGLRAKRLDDWQLGAAMNRGAAVSRPVSGGRRGGGAGRAGGVSGRAGGGLSGGTRSAGGGRHLAAVREPDLWRNRRRARSGMRACAPCTRGGRGPRRSCKELVWREFAYHLMHHTPQITRANWKPEWDAFPGAATIPMPNAGGAA